jgi:hypothetical protein
VLIAIQTTTTKSTSMRHLHNNVQNYINKEDSYSKIKKIASCWTSDGKILVKSHDDRTINIQNETDLEQFLKIRVNTNITNGSSQPNRRKACSSSRLNISAVTFAPQADQPVTSTPVSSQSVQKTQGSSKPG